jgi:alpha-tubulin suppressor-like RCC1 family protein
MPMIIFSLRSHYALRWPQSVCGRTSTQRTPTMKKLIYLLSMTIALLNTARSDAATPVKATQVVGGYAHFCALTQDGGVKCWGHNNSGQLGNGSIVDSATPVDVAGLSSGVTAIGAGADQSCALLATGGAKCWGATQQGTSSVPQTVSGLPSGTLLAVDVGDTHTCALFNAGTVWCWGFDDKGQLGDGKFSATNNQDGVAMSGLSDRPAVINAGDKKTCVLSVNGVAQCVGWNDDGQLGDGSFTSRSLPVNIMDDAPYGHITGKGLHTCGIYFPNAGVRCWGDDSQGQLGDNDANHAGKNMPGNVFDLQSGASDITANIDHTCVVMGSGGVKCWGSDAFGQLGVTRLSLGGASTSDKPVDAVGLSASAIAISSAQQATCALMQYRGIQCWGRGDVGQLGNGQSGNGYSRPAPVDVVDFVNPGFIFADGFEATAIGGG